MGERSGYPALRAPRLALLMGQALVDAWVFKALGVGDCYVIKVWDTWKLSASSHSRRPYNPKGEHERPRACVQRGQGNRLWGTCSVLLSQLFAPRALCNCSSCPLR